MVNSTLFNDNKKNNVEKKNNQNNLEILLQNFENISRRLKLNEEKQTLLSRKFELLEQNFVNFEKSTNLRISRLNEQMEKLIKEFNEIKEDLKEIIQNLHNFADRDSVKVIEKYLETWNPVKFATIDDVNRMIEEKLKRP